MALLSYAAGKEGKVGGGEVEGASSVQSSAKVSERMWEYIRRLANILGVIALVIILLQIFNVNVPFIKVDIVFVLLVPFK